MGSSRKGDSTRARKARFAKKLSKPPDRPPRTSNSAGSLPMDETGEPNLAKPTLPPEMGNPAEGKASLSAWLTLINELRQISLRLDIARSVTYTASAALRYYRAELSEDVAVTLRRCVGDELDKQHLRLDAILKRLEGGKP